MYAHIDNTFGSYFTSDHTFDRLFGLSHSFGLFERQQESKNVLDPDRTNTTQIKKADKCVQKWRKAQLGLDNYRLSWKWFMFVGICRIQYHINASHSGGTECLRFCCSATLLLPRTDDVRDRYEQQQIRQSMNKKMFPICTSSHETPYITRWRAHILWNYFTIYNYVRSPGTQIGFVLL